MFTTSCAVCGAIDNLEKHHVVPLSAGGSDSETNMLVVCSYHHGVLHGVERNSISNLTKRGIEKKRSETGGAWGRPKGVSKRYKLDNHRSKIVTLLHQNASLSEIANELGVSKSTVHDYVNRANLRNQTVR